MQSNNILEQFQSLRKSDNPTSLLNFLGNVEANAKFSSSSEKGSFLNLLLKDLETKKWNEQITTQALSTIRILGRDPVGSDPLFTKEGIVLLVKLAFEPNQVKDTSSSREALKCIANCIHLKEEVKVYLEQDDVIGLCQRVLQSENPISQDTQFLTCRILFFLTVNRPDLVSRLIESNIWDPIAKVLSDNVSILEDTTKAKLIDQNVPINPLTVTSEALKILFNLLLVDSRTRSAAAAVTVANNTATNTKDEKHNNSNDDASSAARATAESFESCLVPIFHLLFNVPYAEPLPLVPPHSQAIHVLMQYPYTNIVKVWKSQSDWTSHLYSTPEEGLTFIVTTLVGVLDRSIHTLIPKGDPDNTEDASQIDATLSPLLLVLRPLAEGDPQLAKALAKFMLPNEKDRLNPVNEGTSLPAYMIRFMTSTMMPLTRNGASETLYVLCNKDANEFTQKVGYGNAVGFLVNKGIAMEPPKETTSEEGEEKESINPITGQYVSQEKLPDLKDMTDEEKEREAERLFVLFERLKKTGIIDVENPIAKAMQENQGRFEEIDSDEEESG